MQFFGVGRPQMVSVEAVVTRADGTVEDLGVIAYYHRNPLRRWAWALRRRFTRLAGRPR